MARLIVRGFTISLDGYGAGPNQSLENPLGVGGEKLHGWFVNTPTFLRMQGKEGGEEMHLAVSPILLGSGERLLAGLDLPALGYRCTECVQSAKAAHYTVART